MELRLTNQGRKPTFLWHERKSLKQHEWAGQSGHQQVEHRKRKISAGWRTRPRYSVTKDQASALHEMGDRLSNMELKRDVFLPESQMVKQLQTITRSEDRHPGLLDRSECLTLIEAFAFMCFHCINEYMGVFNTALIRHCWKVLRHTLDKAAQRYYHQKSGAASHNETTTLRQWSEVEKTLVDLPAAGPAYPVNKTSTATPFSISKLVPVLTRQMERYAKRYKNFSYQFGWKGQLTAYVSGLSREAIDDLTQELEKHLGQHIPKEHVKVEVITCVPTTTLCCGGIGTTLNVGEATQLVGLYLQYDRKGAIFWVSSAHGLLSHDRRHIRLVNNPLQKEAAETSVTIRSRLAACSPLSVVDLLAQYAAMSYNGIAISRNTEILRRCGDMHVSDVAAQKPTLCYSVDIMLGPTPLTSWHLRDSSTSFAFQLKSAAKGCGHPPLCSIKNHRSINPLYTITGIRQYEMDIKDNTITFDMSDLESRRLFAYLGDDDKLAQGTVYGPPLNRYVTNVVGENCVSQNMILICPTEDSCRPRQGHSGSVWVQKCGDQCEAVAITCAVMKSENPAVTMWLAAPLCACLVALSEEYPEVFRDHSKFTVLM